MLFAALGDDTRLALLQRLSHEGPASISVLAESFDVTRQAVTKHLNVLSEAGIVEGRYEGREHIWALNPRPLAGARRYLELIARDWDDALARLKEQIEEG